MTGKGKITSVKQRKAEKGELYTVMATIVDLAFSWIFHNGNIKVQKQNSKVEKEGKEGKLLP